ncbi:dimethylargininase [Salininema proteolyticum]|uniref:Dimethylargininase n=1 Tax=Salininema proteolyticum TaxID=1607685 RepID=A0ABV8TUK0_9ACTN
MQTYARNSAGRGDSRTFLMCRPSHYAVEYAINPWMDTSQPVDAALAASQWETLKDAYLAHGHEVVELEPQPGLPDMVFSANGAFSVDGRVYGARFRYPERSDEAASHADWYADRPDDWAFHAPRFVNEGEGDFTYVEGPGLILAGWGFRTDPAAHAEAGEVLRRPVVSLRLVDDRYYHLDTALAVLDDRRICYLPEAFSADSQVMLRNLFPDAVIATEEDGAAFGLNFVSDGENVFINAEAEALGEKLAAEGFTVVPIDLSELKKGGGSVKCCTAELRR